MSSLIVKEVEKNEVYHLRQKVLWPQLPLEHCMLDDDDVSTHIGAFVGDDMVGTASLVLGDGWGRLRKFAILPEHRNLGIGTTVIKYVIDTLRRNKMSTFWLDARETAIPFYEKIGMLVEGDRFYKEDIAYFKMSMNIETLN